ncbi:MAG TPA: type II secretion system protein [Candidatus Saccharibacteria bacterium]|jgi:prepilin-type N-terminal cleavage/methylation domain-containing protein|nr:type II secretion system protein [Candidatus Saccharibacteria bacterium]HMT55344.1 type II secretion system protein [Candidatus Saccharibacteria bacterium]
MVTHKLRSIKKGFTIIEVMIVMAIAGLILAVVLIAIPQLQRSQRDNARQSVLSRLTSEFGAYAGNNDGKFPVTTETLEDFMERYITGKVDIKNPSSGADYEVIRANSATTDPTEAQILMYPGMACDGEGLSGSLSNSGTAREYALRLQLERADVYYCVDNK